MYLRIVNQIVEVREGGEKLPGDVDITANQAEAIFMAISSDELTSVISSIIANSTPQG